MLHPDHLSTFIFFISESASQCRLCILHYSYSFHPYSLNSSMHFCPYSENKSGDDTHPCLLFENLPSLSFHFLFLLFFFSQYTLGHKLISLLSILISFSMSIMSSCLTVSNAFSKSTKHIKTSFCTSIVLSTVTLKAKITLAVPLPFLTPLCTFAI